MPCHCSIPFNRLASSHDALFNQGLFMKEPLLKLRHPKPLAPSAKMLTSAHPPIRHDRQVLVKISALIFSFSCLAAALSASADPVIEQLTVTASRLPLAIHESGAALTVIDRDDIRAQGARTLAELLQGLPGMSISRQGPSGALTQVRMRGAEANHVLVLVDGVRANDPATGDEFRWEFLTTGNVDRVEIVRGPQSALWGSDAVAAVVHVAGAADALGSTSALRVHTVQKGSHAFLRRP